MPPHEPDPGHSGPLPRPVDAGPADQFPGYDTHLAALAFMVTRVEPLDDGGNRVSCSSGGSGGITLAFKTARHPPAVGDGVRATIEWWVAQ